MGQQVHQENDGVSWSTWASGLCHTSLQEMGPLDVPLPPSNMISDFIEAWKDDIRHMEEGVTETAAELMSSYTALAQSVTPPPVTALKNDDLSMLLVQSPLLSACCCLGAFSKGIPVEATRLAHCEAALLKRRQRIHIEHFRLKAFQTVVENHQVVLAMD